MDTIDFAQELALAHADRAIAEHRARLSPTGTPGTVFCEACDTAIPPARRAAMPGVTRCVACQEALEKAMGR